LESSPEHERRKTVTIVFCDIVGSTALGERADVEAVRGLLTRWYADMRAVVERYGGTVEKFSGDDVMAVFGVPTVHEDDALRAVGAAADMRAAVARLNEEAAGPRGLTLSCRIGVNTGEVLAGAPDGAETFVTGDAVNLAKRLEQAAGTGEILLGEATFPFVRDAVTVGSVRRFEVKGKQHAVAAMPLERVDPWAAGWARRLDVPIVDREVELAELHRAFARVLEEHRAVLCTVIGPAGIGKSRLVAELLAEIGDRALVLHSRCISYGEGITYWPLRQVVQQLGGGDALAGLLGDDPDADRIASHVRTAIGSDEGPLRSEETFWAVRRLFEALAARSPVVLCVEDVQWAEAPFLDLLEYVLQWSERAPILLLSIGRGELVEHRPGWAGLMQPASFVPLGPLGRDDALALLEGMRGETLFTADTQAKVLDAAEGNPLFVEQMTAMAAESGGVQVVPVTIHALIAQRIDRLSRDERVVLECAAVSGYEFLLRAVVELSPPALHADTGRHVLALVRKELIRPRPSLLLGQDGFRFVHGLVREAAYAAIPKTQRAELHERFAHWLSANVSERRIEIGELIGFHLEQAYRYRRELGGRSDADCELGREAGRILAAAGRRALSHGDGHGAVNLLGRALELPIDDRDVHALRRDHAAALRDSGELERAEHALVAARSAAGEVGDAGVCALVDVDLAFVRLHTQPRDWADSAAEVAARAIELLDEEDEPAGVARAWLLTSLVHYTRGHIAEMETALAQVLPAARRGGVVRDLSAALNASARAALVGPTPVAAAVERCESIAADGAGDRVLLAVTHGVRSVLEALRGEFDAARAHMRTYEATLEELGQTRLLAAMVTYGATTELVSGQAAAATERLAAGVSQLEHIGDRGNVAPAAALLAEALAAQGRDDEALDATVLSERAAAPDDVHAEIAWRTTRATLLARRGEAEQAEELARDAVTIAATTDCPLFQAAGFEALEAVRRASGDAVEADRARALAIEAYRAKGAVVLAERAASRVSQPA
jgi:class 3 adenylate cyclase